MDGLNSKSMKAAQIELNGFNVFFFLRQTWSWIGWKMEVDLGGGKVNMIEIWNFDWSQRINKISKSKKK